MKGTNLSRGWIPQEAISMKGKNLSRGKGRQVIKQVLPFSVKKDAMAGEAKCVICPKIKTYLG